MAVFLLNNCKFAECGLTFPNLTDLIQHIETTHIDYDPIVIQQKEAQQPSCLPLSYVLRFISDTSKKDQLPAPLVMPQQHGGGQQLSGAVNSVNGVGQGGIGVGAGGGGGSERMSTASVAASASSTVAAGTAPSTDLKRKLAIKHHSYSISSSNRSNTPTGSEMDEEESMVVSESEDSNDSWTTEEFSSEFIMRYGSRHSGTGTGANGSNEKPFACPVPGCKKRYKNVNGIKYHSKNGHKKDGKVRKGFKCHCGKSYKTAQGLKNHSLSSHQMDTNNHQQQQQQLSQPHQPHHQTTVGSLMSQMPGPQPTRNSISPTGSTCSNTSSTSFGLNQGGGGGGGCGMTQQATTIHNASIQLSPASSLSSLSANTNGIIINGGGGGGGGGGATAVATATGMKPNYGLITIKGKNNILAGPKFVKLVATTTTASVDDGRMDGHRNGGSGVGLTSGGQTGATILQSGGTQPQSLPGLLNLGILTPATSPRTNSTSSTSSGCSSMSSANSSASSSMELLPLTPVSPTKSNGSGGGQSSSSIVSIQTSSVDSDHMSDDT